MLPLQIPLHILYVIERIEDLFNLGIKIGNNETKALIRSLQRELQRLHKHVTCKEENKEQLEQQFCQGIEPILDKVEDILDGLKNSSTISWPFQIAKGIKRTSNATDSEINDLLKKIEGLFMTSSEPTYNFITGNNNNVGGNQISGSIDVHIDYRLAPVVRHVAGRETYGHVPNVHLVGFRMETQMLLHHVFQNDQKKVVGIVGMGGSGKTTLAKHVYHHADVKSHFVHKVWICVSQSRSILYEILSQITQEGEAPMGREVTEKWSEQEIAGKLYKILSAQRYLIILDDIWDVDAWKSISPTIPLNGSKIVVTSRKEDVVNDQDPAIFVLRPEPLNDDDSYELFCKSAFIDDSKQSASMQLLGKEIVMKCDGLPLAITILAGALGANKSPSHWQFVNQSLEERLTDVGDSTGYSRVKEVLAFSYHDLPCNLKKCFLYLAIFPRNYKIRIGRLIKMWMAECLITHNDQFSDEKTMMIAGNYLDQLARRHIIQVVEENYMGRVKIFQIHDLIRDMCVEKAKENGFLKPSLRIAVDLTSTSWRQGQQQCRDIIDSILRSANSSRLRSLSVRDKDLSMCLLNNMQAVFNKFKFLRVFIAEAPFLDEDFVVPEAIGDLVHLRYLGLYANVIKLPHSFGNLQNLQTLDMRSFLDAKAFRNLGKLKNLKHLYLSTSMSTSMVISRAGTDPWPVLKLDKLKNLETLWARGDDWMLSEMAGLSPNLRKLCIFEIPRQEHLNAVYHCQSILSGKLQTLTLEWKLNNAELQIEALQKCKNLRKLSLSGKIQENNSTPLPFPQNLVHLELKFSQLRETDLLAVIGDKLRRLKILILGWFSYLSTEMTCNAGSFPELEKLEFRGLPILKLWTIEKDAMPNLKELTFCQCYSLHQLEFLRLPNLKLREVNIRFVQHKTLDYKKDFQEWKKQHPGITSRSNIYEFELPSVQDPCLNPGKWVKLINSRLLNEGRKNPFRFLKEEDKYAWLKDLDKLKNFSEDQIWQTI